MHIRQSESNILYQGNYQSEYQVHNQGIYHDSTIKRNRCFHYVYMHFCFLFIKGELRWKIKWKQKKTVSIVIVICRFGCIGSITERSIVLKLVNI